MVTTAAVAALNSEGGFMKQFVAIRPWADEIIQGWRKSENLVGASSDIGE